MTFTQKALEYDFTLATGNFQNSTGGSGNSLTVKGLRSHATIVKAGGVSAGGANIEIFGLPLTTMNALATYGQVLTLTGRNTVTVRAGEVDGTMSTVFMGTVTAASMDGQAQPDVPFRVEAFVGGYENVKPVQPTSQPGSQSVATLMQTVAGKAGLQFENSGVNAQVRNPYLPGTAIQQMHELADMSRIERIVDNGTLAIWPAGGYRQGEPTVISPQTGLVSYPIFDSQGIIVRTLWQPTLTYGGQITVQSSMTPACGTWIVHKLTYELASMMPNGAWFCDIWAHRPGVQPVA